jgi:hypothetical protein
MRGSDLNGCRQPPRNCAVYASFGSAALGAALLSRCAIHAIMGIINRGRHCIAHLARHCPLPSL